MVTKSIRVTADQHTKTYKNYVKNLPTTNLGTTAYTNLVGYQLDSDKLDFYGNTTELYGREKNKGARPGRLNAEDQYIKRKHTRWRLVVWTYGLHSGQILSRHCSRWCVHTAWYGCHTRWMETDAVDLHLQRLHTRWRN